MKRFSFLQVLGCLLLINVCLQSLRSAINWMQEPGISFSRAIANWSLTGFLYPLFVLALVYFFSLNSVYKSLQQGNPGSRLQATAITFILFSGYSILVVIIENTTAYPSLVALSLLFSSIFYSIIVLVIAYLVYHRDIRKKPV